MRKSVLILSLVGSTLGAYLCWQWSASTETAKAAFERHIVRPLPASVRNLTHWRPVGVGGDGLGVFMFAIPRADFEAVLVANASTFYPTHLDSLARRIEIEAVEHRTARRLGVSDLSPMYEAREHGFRKLMLADTNEPAGVVIWYRRDSSHE
jgi:hypothetical protein